MSRGRVSRPGWDCWRHGDLGEAGRIVYNLLAGDITLDAASITRLSGLHRNTVRRKLADLADRDLARRDDAGRWRQGEREPSEVARSGAGKHARDAARYAADRAAYRDYLDQRRGSA